MTTGSRKKRLAAALPLLALTAIGFGSSCASGQTRLKLFSRDWEDDGGRSIEEVRQRLAGAHPNPNANVAVGVAARATKVIGAPLGPGAKVWQYVAEVTSRPVIAGSVVIVAGPREVVGLDAASGQRLWARPTGGLDLRGAGDDGSVTVMTFAAADGVGSVLLAVLRDGTSVRQIERPERFGAPAVLSGLAFIPWDERYLTVLDLSDGQELARMALQEQTTRAFTSGGDLYFGETGLLRFDARIGGASRRSATHLSLPLRTYPGAPILMTSAAAHAAPSANAQDKVRLYAKPAGIAERAAVSPGPVTDDAGSTSSEVADPSGVANGEASHAAAGSEGLALADDRYYSTYFRFAMGYDGTDGALRWVHTGDADILGGAAADAALVTCDELGRVTALDARTGLEEPLLSLGEPIECCVVSADSLPRGAERMGGKTLAEQLRAAIGHPDATLVPAQRVLLQELAALPDDAATAALATLATEGQSGELHGEVCAALAARKDGVEPFLAVLARPYDYLKAVLSPPPVGAVGRALALMKDGRGGAALLPYLMDPATADADLRDVARALVALREPGAIGPLEKFFAMYKGTADSPALAEAVVAAAEGVVAMGGPRGKARIERAARDATTLPEIKAKLASVLDAVDRGAAPSSGHHHPGGDQRP